MVVFANVVTRLVARLASRSTPQIRLLALVTESLLNKHIADRFGIREHTTQAHIVLLDRELTDPSPQS